MISIKEVSKQTGITVRTMRHYDHIGLLTPAGKTEGGHRLYGKKELKKLQEIQFLKTLGFSLQEIKVMLSDQSNDWPIVLQNQLNYVLQEKNKLEEIERSLHGLLNEYKIEGKIDLNNISKMIHLYQSNLDKREIYRSQLFQEDQKLLDLLPNINRGDPDTLEWVSLIAQLKRNMSKGVDSPEVQQIIQRMDEKARETYGDNEEFLEKFWEVRKSSEHSKKVGFYPLDTEFLQFIEKAFEIYLKNR
ncbi:MerR family transcriptional regulator [Hazenella coriacea]|nr:MerR family transcriptional regulator [Hazenella coriacea]